MHSVSSRWAFLCSTNINVRVAELLVPVHGSYANLNGGVLTTSIPICQQAVAKGTQSDDLSGNGAGGEKDAEILAEYTMVRSTVSSWPICDCIITDI